jgi:exopolysaccharide biosynthesis WecB/TagA/CpsF family protein
VIRNDVPALRLIAERLETTPPDVTGWFDAARTRCISVTFCNPLSVRIARDGMLLDDLAGFDHVFADGMLLARCASRLRGVPVPRVSFDGNSLARVVLLEAAARDAGIALVGGREGVAGKAAITLAREFATRLVFARHGYFSSPQEVATAIAALRASRAGLAIVGMGGGAQERFICALRESGWHGVAISCGGYLDQLAGGGRVRYYPRWVNALNLRAPWRVLHEPGRLLPRYLFDYQPFYRAALQLLLRGERA